jgi:hypothetical protein
VDHITISGSVLQALADDKDVADFRGEDLDVDVKQSQAKVAGRGQSPFGTLKWDKADRVRRTRGGHARR